MTRTQAALPDTNLQVMEHLHAYRFLTAPQLLRLGVASHVNSLRRTLRRFETGRKYVDWAEFGVLPRIGRLPRVYYLTERGARYLAEAWRVEPAEINYPRGVKLFSRDYFHRGATIDFHIELRRFAAQYGLTVEVFHSYFDTAGANRNENPADRLRHLSKVPLEDSFFIPDAIFAVRASDGSRYLFVLEVYNGIDTKRVLCAAGKASRRPGRGAHQRTLWLSQGTPGALRVRDRERPAGGRPAPVRGPRLHRSDAPAVRLQHAGGAARRLCRRLAFPYARPSDDLRQRTTGIAGQRSAAGGGAAGGVTSRQEALSGSMRRIGTAALRADTHAPAPSLLAANHSGLRQIVLRKEVVEGFGQQVVELLPYRSLGRPVAAPENGERHAGSARRS